MNSKFGTPIKYGIIGALVTVILSVMSYMFYAQLFSSFFTQIAVGILFFGAGLFIAIWGGVTFRRENNGVLSFQDAFVGVLIILLFSAVASTVMGYLISNVIDPQYPEKLVELIKSTTRDSMEKWGTPDDKIEETMKSFTIEKFKPTLLSSAKGLGMGLLWSSILALIIGAFIRRNPEVVVRPQEEDSPST